jgi:hypothetical protein
MASSAVGKKQPEMFFTIDVEINTGIDLDTYKTAVDVSYDSVNKFDTVDLTKSASLFFSIPTTTKVVTAILYSSRASGMFITNKTWTPIKEYQDLGGFRIGLSSASSKYDPKCSGMGFPTIFLTKEGSEPKKDDEKSSKPSERSKPTSLASSRSAGSSHEAAKPAGAITTPAPTSAKKETEDGLGFDKDVPSSNQCEVTLEDAGLLMTDWETYPYDT